MFKYSDQYNIGYYFTCNSIVVDFSRSFHDVTDLLPRMPMPILLIREKEIFLRIHSDHRARLILFFINHIGQTRVKLTALSCHTAGCRYYDRAERTVFYLLNSLIIRYFLFFFVYFVGFLQVLVHIPFGVWILNYHNL